MSGACDTWISAKMSTPSRFQKIHFRLKNKIFIFYFWEYLMGPYTYSDKISYSDCSVAGAGLETCMICPLRHAQNVPEFDIGPFTLCAELLRKSLFSTLW